MMKRLDGLLFHNNSISRIHPQIGSYLPNLTTLMLTNNKLVYYYEIEHLSSIPKLSVLCLADNPVSYKQYYREVVIYRIPQLKVLDFQKITAQEKKNIKQFFETNPAGKQFLIQIESEKQLYYQQLQQKQQQNNLALSQPPRLAPSMNGAAAAPSSSSSSFNGKGTVALTEEQKAQVRNAIENAQTKEEIDLIEQQLKVRFKIISLFNLYVCFSNISFPLSVSVSVFFFFFFLILDGYLSFPI
jgi:U2 small nuclear ribonucleoprotein A'